MPDHKVSSKTILVTLFYYDLSFQTLYSEKQFIVFSKLSKGPGRRDEKKILNSSRVLWNPQPFQTSGWCTLMTWQQHLGWVLLNVNSVHYCVPLAFWGGGGVSLWAQACGFSFPWILAFRRFWKNGGISFSGQRKWVAIQLNRFHAWLQGNSPNDELFGKVN